MKTLVGDLLELAELGEFDVIVHGCNCQCAMGRGIAAAIRRRYPAAFEADRETPKGSREKLGTYSSAEVATADHTFRIVNAYTQFHWTGPGVLADYGAIRRVFLAIRQDFSGLRIGYPLIGAGFAKGDWTEISGIIDDALNGEDHTLVRLPADSPFHSRPK